MNMRKDGALRSVVHVKQCGLRNISIPTILWQSVLEEAWLCVSVISCYRDRYGVWKGWC